MATLYLIQKKNNKVIEQADSRGPLRRQQKAMKNPTSYAISKFKSLTDAKPGRPAVSKKEKTARKERRLNRNATKQTATPRVKKTKVKTSKRTK